MNPSPPAPDESCPLNEQAVGWALHALEPDEEMAVLLHLPQCPSCRSAAHGAEEVMSALGRSVEQVDPPAALRESLLARVAETPQRQPGTPPQPDPAPLTAPRQEDRTAPTRVVRDAAPAPRRSWVSRYGRRLVAASLVLLAAVSIGGLAVRSAQLEQQRDAVAAQARSATDLLQQLGRPGTRYALLNDPDSGTTVAAVVVDDDRREVYTVGLPSNAIDRAVYVLWGVDSSGVPQPLGTFDVTTGTTEMRVVGAGAQLDAFGQYAVSLEPGRVAPPSPSSVAASGAVAA